MRAENARRFTSAPGESPIGSRPLPPTQVDSPSMRVLRCVLPEPHGEPEQTPELLYSLRPLNRHDHGILSIVFRIPGHTRPGTTPASYPSAPKLVPNQRATIPLHSTLRNRCP